LDKDASTGFSLSRVESIVSLFIPQVYDVTLILFLT